MCSTTSENESLSLKDARGYGGGAIFYGLLIGIPLVLIFLPGDHIYDIYILINIVSFWGLFIIGLFVVCQSRYVLFVLIPFSIIGLMAIPTGTVIYIALVKVLWKFMPLYFPFDRKQRFDGETKADDT